MTDRRTTEVPAPPDVSIVLPTHDRPVELRRAVRSVLGQELTSWELLVVDDGSPAPVAATELAPGDPRVSVLRVDRNRGVAAARNTAVAAARGRWIAFLDDDDFWHPRKLSAQLREAERTGATFLYGSSIKVRRDGRVVTRLIAPPPDELQRRLIEDNVVGGPSTVMVQADELRRAGPFDTGFSVLADWDMWLRLSQQAVVAAVPEPQTGVLHHEGSMQVTEVASIEGELELLRRRHGALAAAHGVRIGGRSTDTWLAAKRLAAQPDTGAALRYYGRALAQRGLTGTLRSVAHRRRRRRERAPAWVLDQLAS